MRFKNDLKDFLKFKDFALNYKCVLRLKLRKINILRMNLSKIRKEFKHFTSNPPEGCSVEIIAKTIWHVTIIGPKDTPYSNGTFIFAIEFQSPFPRALPKIKALTPIFHMNFLVTGTANVTCQI